MRKEKEKDLLTVWFEPSFQKGGFYTHTHTHIYTKRGSKNERKKKKKKTEMVQVGKEKTGVSETGLPVVNFVDGVPVESALHKYIYIYKYIHRHRYKIWILKSILLYFL